MAAAEESYYDILEVPKDAEQVHACAKLTWQNAAAAAAATAASTAAAAGSLAQRRHGKKNQDFYENLKNEKIAKNIEKINENR